MVIALVLVTLAVCGFLLYRYLCHNKGVYRTAGEPAPGVDPDQVYNDTVTPGKKEYFIWPARRYPTINSGLDLWIQSIRCPKCGRSTCSVRSMEGTHWFKGYRWSYMEGLRTINGCINGRIKISEKYRFICSINKLAVTTIWFSYDKVTETIIYFVLTFLSLNIISSPKTVKSQFQQYPRKVWWDSSIRIIYMSYYLL